MCVFSVFCRKWQYAVDALGDPDPFEADTVLDAHDVKVAFSGVLGVCVRMALLKAIQWLKETPAEEVIAQREEITTKIIKAAELMNKSGVWDNWFRSSPQHVKDLCQDDVAGPLLEQLARVTNFRDADAVSLFRTGAGMLNELEASGLGEPVESNARPAVALKENCQKSNDELASGLRQDTNAEKLMEITLADVVLGRMTAPVPYNSAEMAHVHLSPRFSVEQEKVDGTKKVRPIDHFSWSGGHGGRASKHRRKEESVNGYTFPKEKLKTQTLDYLWAAMAIFVQTLGELPCLFKADINAAFRRVPICNQDRWACGVAFRWLDQIFVSMHHSCPFGAIGSVHAWERCVLP